MKLKNTKFTLRFLNISGINDSSSLEILLLNRNKPFRLNRLIIYYR